MGYINSLKKNKKLRLERHWEKHLRALESSDRFEAKIFILIPVASIQANIIPAPLTREDKILGRRKLIQPKREKSFKPHGCAPDGNDFSLQQLLTAQLNLPEIKPCY